jgi:hypothetical protein
MKKLLLSLSVLSMAFFNSCGGGGSGHIMNTAAPDAAAAVEMFFTLEETTGIAGFGPWGQVAVVAISAAAGAHASGAFGRSTNLVNTSGKNSKITLLNSYLNKNNSFEKFGSFHNLLLNKMNKSGDLNVVTQKLKTYEYSTWREYFNEVAPELTDANVADIVANIKTNQVMEKVSNSGALGLKTYTDLYSYIDKSTYSNAFKTDIKSIVQNIEKRNTSDLNYQSQIDYLNLEINKRLKPKSNYTKEEAGVLVFLSVAKHSTYYWYSN